MPNRLLAAVDAALDDVAAATDYAHPLVDPAAVAWLEEQFDAGLGPTGRRLRPYARFMADVLDDSCACAHNLCSPAYCASRHYRRYDHLAGEPLHRFQASYAGWNPDDPLMPEHLREDAQVLHAARELARGYADAHWRNAPLLLRRRRESEARVAAAAARAYSAAHRGAGARARTLAQIERFGTAAAQAGDAFRGLSSARLVGSITLPDFRDPRSITLHGGII